MNKNEPVYKQLARKYHKTEEVTNFKDMLYRSGDIYRSRTAFKRKDKDGKIYSTTYAEFKNDVVYLGTSLIEKGFLNKRIAVIGKNSYEWSVSYLAASIVGVVVPIDKELHTHDVINFMNVSQTVCILGDTKNLNSILDNIEKRYLENVLRPFKNRVMFIAKTEEFGYEHIYIRVALPIHKHGNTTCNFPYFDKGTMYKGMELYKPYSLEELGLFENDGDEDVD